MNDDDLWLDALLDDELDASASLALQRRLAAEPALQRRFEERRALRDAVRAQATRHAAPDANHTLVRADETFRMDDEPDHLALCRREQASLLAAIRDDLDLTDHMADHMADAVNSLRIVLAADESIRSHQVVTL